MAIYNLVGRGGHGSLHMHALDNIVESSIQSITLAIHKA